ncbi:hypothetical protein DsansV1_C27g0201231 [Dioscorea sansibarensis]
MYFYYKINSIILVIHRIVCPMFMSSNRTILVIYKWSGQCLCQTKEKDHSETGRSFHNQLQYRYTHTHTQKLK